MAQPDKTCSIDRLITHPGSIAKVLAGDKTAQRRNGVYGWVGETFSLGGETFEITALHQQRLGDMTDEHARQEGAESLAAYKAMILGMHRGMRWNDDAMVWVHEFARRSTPA